MLGCKNQSAGDNAGAHRRTRHGMRRVRGAAQSFNAKKTVKIKIKSRIQRRSRGTPSAARTGSRSAGRMPSSPRRHHHGGSGWQAEGPETANGSDRTPHTAHQTPNTKHQTPISSRQTQTRSSSHIAVTAQSHHSHTTVTPQSHQSAADKRKNTLLRGTGYRKSAKKPT